jgi:hypothetical protein
LVTVMRKLTNTMGMWALSTFGYCV